MTSSSFVSFVFPSRSLVVLVFACAACSPVAIFDDVAGGAGGTAKTTLVDNTRWEANGAKTDPFIDERPETVECPDWSFGEENGTLEVDTGGCEYLSVSQPSLSEAKAGDTVHISLWHDVLFAAEPATGHAAITLGGDLLWEKTFEIPSYPSAHSPQILLEKDYPEGSPILFHLHNHGSNNWRLLSMSLERPLDAD
jgi:hypothetical protein